MRDYEAWFYFCLCAHNLTLQGYLAKTELPGTSSGGYGKVANFNDTHSDTRIGFSLYVFLKNMSDILYRI